METTKIEKDLKAQLESAITAENYSEAAKIKEKLKDLTSNNVETTKIEEDQKTIQHLRRRKRRKSGKTTESGKRFNI